MVNANETRLGNWVLRDGYPMQINEIKMYSTSGKPTINGWEEENFEPVPITEEVFLNCGFKIKVRTPYSPQQRFKLKAHKAFVLERSTIRDSWYYHSHGGGLNVKVENLHQLQNLFYATTGTELIYIT